MNEIAVFAGSAGVEFATEMCAELGVELKPSRIQRFANDCLEAQLLTNCRQRDVFIVQPLVAPVQENLMELLLMIDAARGASAGRITAVIPHYSYARSDKKDAPRISIGGRLVADLLKSSGADRVLTMTLHSPQVQAFFRVPVDQLHALNELAEHFRRDDLSNTIVVSPDLGNAKTATTFSRMLGTPVAAGAKQRFENDQVRITSMIGDVTGKDVIVLDDEIANGSTILEVLRLLADEGVESVKVACTHGILSNGAVQRIASVPAVTEIVCTNTVP
ncbi:MAG TPA: ribose-phosphate pyrophosphokinase, partial [Propioniciclava sp.]